METMRDVVRQEIIENQFNAKLINKSVKAFVLNNYSDYLDKSTELVQQWMNGTYYESKNKRLAQLKDWDIKDIVLKLMTKTVQFQQEELYSSAVGQCAAYLGFDDKGDAIKTVAEMLAVICESDWFDIRKNEANSLVIVSRIKLPIETQNQIEQAMYLPPMLCAPLEVKGNRDTGYLTIKDSLVLGYKNHHEGDLCIDVINKMNSVQLALNTDFISKYELEPKKAPKDVQTEHQWNIYKRIAYKVAHLIAIAGNKFYLTHRVDKRGRLYSIGYHITTQGTSYHKASVELAKKEHIALD
jgi:hypothetical protein